MISRHRGLFPRGRAQFQDTGRDLNQRFDISESRGPAQRPRFKTHREARAQFRYAGAQIQAQGLLKFMRHGSGCRESISEHRDPIPGGRRDSNSGHSRSVSRPGAQVQEAGPNFRTQGLKLKNRNLGERLGLTYTQDSKPRKEQGPRVQRSRFRRAATQIQDRRGPNSGHRETQGPKFRTQVAKFRHRGPNCTNARRRSSNSGHSDLVSGRRRRGPIPARGSSRREHRQRARDFRTFSMCGSAA